MVWALIVWELVKDSSFESEMVIVTPLLVLPPLPLNRVLQRKEALESRLEML